MWRDKKVSVIFPTYNEKDSIRAAIEDFFACEHVDEIIVVNNNAARGTDDEVAGTSARIVYETRQGYGYAIWKGLDEATGDLLIISEPDGTFSGHDVYKMLAYSDDVPVVFGTRTVTELVWHGANMGFFIKFGNYAVGKLMEFLFNTTILTDVGCSMRLMHREVYETLRPQFTIGGSAFGPHLMLLTILNGYPFIEIAVNYKTRVGMSSVTGNKVRAFFLGLEMIAMILKTRVLTWLGIKKRVKRRPVGRFQVETNSTDTLAPK
jgi:glycosyltransferase involved in cell wall biosynthesis